MKYQIRVRTKNGKVVNRNAEIIDRMKPDGELYSIAIVGKVAYHEAGRDAKGLIWES
jgi:hypothetical protein